MDYFQEEKKKGPRRAKLQLARSTPFFLQLTVPQGIGLKIRGDCLPSPLTVDPMEDNAFALCKIPTKQNKMHKIDLYSININLKSYIIQVIMIIIFSLLRKFAAIIFAFLIACLFGSLNAAIPQLINYQGLLLDDNGSKVTGIKAITLKVFTGATDGNGTKEIYDENVGNVSITDGLYAWLYLAELDYL